MYNLLLTILLVLSVVIVSAIFMQPAPFNLACIVFSLVWEQVLSYRELMPFLAK